MQKIIGKAVKVTWDDAWQSDSYFDGGDHSGEVGKLLDSYGVCIRNDKKAIMIAMDALLDDGRYRDVKYIPRGMVKTVKILK